jgi:hypothetical protein
MPWVVAIIPNFSSADGRTSWTQTIVPLTSLVKTWILNLSRLFFDLNNIFRYKILFLYIVIITLGVYSIYFLSTQTETCGISIERFMNPWWLRLLTNLPTPLLYLLGLT